MDVSKSHRGDDLRQIFSNIGVFYDLPAAYTPNSGTQDAFIGIQLREDHETSTFEYARRLRIKMHELFPGVEVSFNTGGLITAALNEGKPTPIDVQVKGNKLPILRQIAERIRDTLNTIPSTRDVKVLQRIDQPAKNIDIDRIKAAELGVEPVDAIQNIVSALNSSTTFDKVFWIDEHNGNHYYVGVTYPEHLIDDQHIVSQIQFVFLNRTASAVESHVRVGRLVFGQFDQLFVNRVTLGIGDLANGRGNLAQVP